MCLDPRTVAGWWTLEPLALGPPLLATAVYLAGVRKIWRACGAGRGVRRWEVGAFLAGQATLLAALVSPLDRLSDLLFSAHMTQHELLLVVAPPLVVLGRPVVPLLTLLPELAWIGVRLRRPWRVVGSPVFAVVVHGLAVWLWHVPALFEATLRDELVHAAQHATFFGSAALFWWTLLRGRWGRAGYGVAVLFVFATAAHTSVLGALLTVVARVVYPSYVERALSVEVSPLDDQVLAGLVMWIPASAASLLAALALAFVWLGESGRRVAAIERRRARRSAMV